MPQFSLIFSFPCSFVVVDFQSAAPTDPTTNALHSGVTRLYFRKHMSAWASTTMDVCVLSRWEASDVLAIRVQEFRLSRKPACTWVMAQSWNEIDKESTPHTSQGVWPAEVVISVGLTCLSSQVSAVSEVYSSFSPMAGMGMWIEWWSLTSLTWTLPSSSSSYASASSYASSSTAMKKYRREKYGTPSRHSGSGRISQWG